MKKRFTYIDQPQKKTRTIVRENKSIFIHGYEFELMSFCVHELG